MIIQSPFAVPADLVPRWRTLTSQEEAQAQVLLGDASNKIITEYPLARIADDEDEEDLAQRTHMLKRIVCGMVKRAMMTPSDERPVIESQQAAGPFTVREKYVNPTGDLYFTKADRQDLGQQRAFTIAMSSDAS